MFDQVPRSFEFPTALHDPDMARRVDKHRQTMDDTVRILLDVASQARIELDGSKLAETIILSPNEPFFHSVQNDLIDVRKWSAAAITLSY